METVRALLGQPRERDELRYHTFVFPEHKVLYHETPKAACSAIKVGMLALTGRTLADIGVSRYPRKFSEAVVHDRMAYPPPSLADLDDAGLADAAGGKGWLRFCVVRDPYSRLYAAWEDKIFLGDPSLLDRFDVGVGDRSIDGAIDIRETFTAFVDELAENRDAYFEDFHFRSQCRVLHIDSVPYTDVVPLGDLAQFWSRLQRHVTRLSAGVELALPRINEGLGLPWQNAYTPDAVSKVAEIYADDVQRFRFEPPEIAAGLEPIRLDSAAQALLETGRELVRQLKWTFDHRASLD